TRGCRRPGRSRRGSAMTAARSVSRATWATVLRSSSTNRTAPALNSSVKLLRSRFGRFACSILDTISSSRLVSTKPGQAQVTTPAKQAAQLPIHHSPLLQPRTRLDVPVHLLLDTPHADLPVRGHSRLVVDALGVSHRIVERRGVVEVVKATDEEVVL